MPSLLQVLCLMTILPSNSAWLVKLHFAISALNLDAITASFIAVSPELKSCGKRLVFQLADQLCFCLFLLNLLDLA